MLAGVEKSTVQDGVNIARIIVCSLWTGCIRRAGLAGYAEDACSARGRADAVSESVVTECYTHIRQLPFRPSIDRGMSSTWLTVTTS